MPSIRFDADRIEVLGAVVHEASVQFDGAGQFRLAAARLEAGSQGVNLAPVLVSGRLLETMVNEAGWSLRTEAESLGLVATLDVRDGEDGFNAELVSATQPLAHLAALDFAPLQAAWLKSGTFEAGLQFRLATGGSPEISWRLQLHDLGFDSPDGRYAGEGLQVGVHGEFRPHPHATIPSHGQVNGGELLLDNLYVDFNAAPLQFSARPEWPAGGSVVVPFSLEDDHALSLAGTAWAGAFEGTASTGWDLDIEHLALDFPLAYRRYFEALAAAWTLDGLEVTGSMRWSGGWKQGAFHSGDLDIEDLTVVDTRRGRFALTGLNTRVRPGDYSFESALDWRGLLFGRINLGPGRAVLDSEPGSLALAEPLDLDVLGGRLHLAQLRILMPGRHANRSDESDFRLSARIEGMEMEQLSAALGWPRFTGDISGDIPGATLRDGVLSVDGAILFRVFDGTVRIGDLHVERPFGVLPSLAANIGIENLDLAQLTETFSFGSISGRVDGHVKDLRMLDWQPVAFDAWLGTPPDQKGAEGISRQAVNHLTTIGGGGATTALTSPVMRLFNNFSYRRLGLGCRLQNHACEVSGLSEDDTSVLLLEGAGIPRITIRAYNRRVDWPQMLANLAAVGEGESVRIGSDR